MKNSRNFIKMAAVAASLVLMVSCGEKATVKGVVADAPESEIVVNLLNVNTLEVLDTVKTDANGAFKVKVDVKKGRPEFIYLYRKGVRVAPLLLSTGDKVTVQTDTLGNFEVSGSAEAELYAGVEKDYAAFMDNITELAEAEDFVGIRKAYIDYYRSRVKFLLENPYSMAVVPVLYQTVGDGVLVFSQEADAIHFKNACDSLETVYPESRYVKALRKSTDGRLNILELQNRIANADQLTFPEIELPDMTGSKVKLSSLDSKLIILHFWSPDQVEQSMVNLDVLLPLYEKYHSRGLDIYSIGVTADKTVWANTMRAQKLPWTNVCETPALKNVEMYNVTSVPTTYFIKDGILTDSKITEGEDLNKVIERLLK